MKGNKKNWKTLATPVVAVVAMTAGVVFGLSTAQIDSVEKFGGIVVTGVAAAVNFYGVWKNHDKKK